MTKKSLLLCVCLIFFQAIPSRAGEFGVNLYGISYHFMRTTSEGKAFNEINFGIGAKYVFLNTSRSMAFSEAGIFNDSERNAAKYIGVGYGLKIIDSVLSFGVTIGGYKSPTLNNNRLLLAVIPTVSTRHKWISMHLVYLPAYKNVNRIPTLGLYVTIYPSEF